MTFSPFLNCALELKHIDLFKQISGVNKMFVYFQLQSYINIFIHAVKCFSFRLNCPFIYALTKLCTVYIDTHTLFFFWKKKLCYSFRCVIQFYLFIEIEGKTLATITITTLVTKIKTHAEKKHHRDYVECLYSYVLCISVGYINDYRKDN